MGIIRTTVALLALVVPAAALAQYGTGELSYEDRARLDALRRSQSEQDAKQAAELKAARKRLLASPPLPDERNPLLGSWRLESSPRRTQGDALINQTKSGRNPGDGLGQLLGMAMNFDAEKSVCSVSFGSGITFRPSTYSSDGVAGLLEGAVTYRRGAGQVIVAIPADARANMLPFEIQGPNRIVWGDSCVLLRVGAPAAQTAPAGTGGQGSMQVAAAGPAPQRSTLARPSPEVCRNTLLDQLGKVGVNQVRAMSDVRFKELAIEGKVPNSNNLRIDLRGSACDDPRIKATLYDFDANGMLQAVTYVWDRPAGPAPAPIFAERVQTLSRLHSLPGAQSAGRMQADTTLGRLILQDMPERNLLLEAYAAPR